MFKDATTDEINSAMEAAWKAFHEYRKMTLKQRAAFMKTIGEELESQSDDLIQTAMEETNLPQQRLKGELARTVFQLNNYGAASERGDWLEARIDTAVPDKTPAKPDIRKMLVPLGPIVVFGSSNFCPHLSAIHAPNKQESVHTFMPLFCCSILNCLN